MRFVVSVLCSISFFINGQTTDQFIKTTSGDTLYGKSDYIIPYRGGDPFISFNGTVFKMADIVAVQSERGYYGRFKTGTKTNPSYKFFLRKEAGKINVFNDWEMVQTVFAPGWYQTSRVLVPKYFSKSSDELEKITLGNLKKAMSDNPESREHLTHYEILRNLKIGLILGGIAIIASAFSHVSKENPPSSTKMILGGVVANLSWIPYLMEPTELDEAIRTYNSK